MFFATRRGLQLRRTRRGAVCQSAMLALMKMLVDEWSFVVDEKGNIVSSVTAGKILGVAVYCTFRLLTRLLRTYLLPDARGAGSPTEEWSRVSVVVAANAVRGSFFHACQTLGIDSRRVLKTLVQVCVPGLALVGSGR